MQDLHFKQIFTTLEICFEDTIEIIIRLFNMLESDKQDTVCNLLGRGGRGGGGVCFIERRQKSVTTIQQNFSEK